MSRLTGLRCPAIALVYVALAFAASACGDTDAAVPTTEASGATAATTTDDDLDTEESTTSADQAIDTDADADHSSLDTVDWDRIYRDLAAREQEALTTNDLATLESAVTGRRLDFLSDELGLRLYRGFELDDTGVNRTVEEVSLAEIVEDDHVVLHVTETRSAPEIIRSADGAELHTQPWREEPSQRIQVDLDLVGGEWLTEHHYYLGTAGPIEPLPDGEPVLSVTADDHTVEVYSWLTDDDLECIGFDGIRPDGSGIGDWTRCRPADEFEPPADEFTWQILPIAGDDAPLIHFVVASASLRDDIVLDGERGESAERPNGASITVWLQANAGRHFKFATRGNRTHIGRIGTTECGESRPIGRYPADLEGAFETLADIADAAVAELRLLEWQAGSVEVVDVADNRFTIRADDVDHETASLEWEWRFTLSQSGQNLDLSSIEETRTCR